MKRDSVALQYAYMASMRLLLPTTQQCVVAWPQCHAPCSPFDLLLLASLSYVSSSACTQDYDLMRMLYLLCASSTATHTMHWCCQSAASAPCTALIRESFGGTLLGPLAFSPVLLPVEAPGMLPHSSASSSIAKTPGTSPGSSKGPPSILCPLNFSFTCKCLISDMLLHTMLHPDFKADHA